MRAALVALVLLAQPLPGHWAPIRLQSREVSGTLPPEHGGTGSGALTCTNEFLTSDGAAYSCSPPLLAGPQFANQGTASTVLHGNAAGNPDWSAVALGSDVSGTLPEAQGGTNAGALTCTNQFLTSNGTTYSCTTDTLAGAQHANQGTTTTLLHGNASGNPSFGAVALASDVSGTLGTGNGGTGTASAGTTTTILHGGGAGYAAASLTADVSGVLPAANGGTAQSTYAQGDLLYASAANTLAKLAKGTSGQLLQIGATIPAWAGDTAWTAVSGGVGFQNSWVNSGGTLFAAGFFKDASGFVHLRGNVKSGTVPAAIFTLPAGYRPSARLDVASIDNSLLAVVSIRSTGDVFALSGSNTGLTLDGITFDTR
jgi:hypothetical protein